MMRWIRLGAFALSCALLACQPSLGPGAGPRALGPEEPNESLLPGGAPAERSRTPENTAAPPPPANTYRLAAGPTYSTAFSNGAAEWVNVTSLYGAAPWLVKGTWQVVSPSYGGKALRQSGMNWSWYGGAPPLSFMRYNGKTFGNGLPNRYHVTVTFRVLGCDPKDPFYPIGDTGVQVYFVDPTHYVEMIYRPKTIEAWECNGGVPYRYPGWRLLGRYPVTNRTYTPLVVKALVDIPSKSCQITLPSGAQYRYTSNVIGYRPHWLTLRASNSIVDYNQVTITAL